MDVDVDEQVELLSSPRTGVGEGVEIVRVGGGVGGAGSSGTDCETDAEDSPKNLKIVQVHVNDVSTPGFKQNPRNASGPRYSLVPQSSSSAIVSSASQKDENSKGNVSVTTQTDLAKKPETTEQSDPIALAIGDFGKWQFQMTVLLSLFNVPCTWHIMAFAFQSLDPSDYWCVSAGNNTVFADKSDLDPCYIKELNNRTGELDVKVCERWEFNTSVTGTSVISEWGLVCQYKSLKNLADMMFLAGVAVGGFLGIISDRFGRKVSLMGSLVMQLVLGSLVAICPWYSLYLVLRLFLGLFSVNVVFSGFVLCVELVSGKWLTICGVCYLLPLPVSYIMIAGIGYIIRDWRVLQWTITLPGALLLGLWCILPESPRWLLTRGRLEETVEVLEDAARINQTALPPNTDKILKQSLAAIEASGGAPRVQCCELYRTPKIRLISLVLYLVWFSVYLVYYGLVLNLSKLGDIYVNTAISGAVELPAIILSIFILLRTGRRKPLSYTMLGAGIPCLLMTVVTYFSGNRDGRNWMDVTMAMFGKFSISASNVIMPVYTAELFPTVIRNLGVGMSNIPAGIALIIVPFLWETENVEKNLPWIILGFCGVMGGLSVLLLPEIEGLTSTLEELEEEANVPAIIPPPRKASAVAKDIENC
ncbi:organic cation transporter protein isoform X1 [Bemisia tabaci]|uniref:organic cation transporter protein isoform X1 n=1 Tax=Bemisia tabaci TaxID=7038 RepID=UPI003B282D4A